MKWLLAGFSLLVLLLIALAMLTSGPNNAAADPAGSRHGDQLMGCAQRTCHRPRTPQHVGARTRAAHG